MLGPRQLDGAFGQVYDTSIIIIYWNMIQLEVKVFQCLFYPETIYSAFIVEMTITICLLLAYDTNAFPRN